MANKPTLKQLEAFVELAQTGHFAETARRLNTTQPNISNRISSLEAVVGGQVIDRATQPFRLTPLGLDLLPHAKAALDQVTRLTEASQNPRLRPRVLRLGLTELAEWALLSAFAKALKGLYPEMAIETRTGLSADIERELQSGNLDMALCNAPFVADELSRAPLADFDWVFVRSLELSEAASAPWLSSARETRAYGELQQLVPADVPLVPGTSLSATRILALEGQGIAIVPAVMVQEDLRSGRLVKVEQARAPSPLEFSILYDPGRPGGWLSHIADAMQGLINK